MVQMGMGQEQDVNGRRVEAEIVFVVFLEFMPALEHAAIHEDLQIAHRHKMAGARDCPGGAMK